jgi:hypothetical protein
MTAELLQALDAIHCALALAIDQPPHKKAAVRSILHLAMVALTSLKTALADAKGEEGF